MLIHKTYQSHLHGSTWLTMSMNFCLKIRGHPELVEGSSGLVHFVEKFAKNTLRSDKIASLYVMLKYI